MASKKLSISQLTALQLLEPELRQAVANAEPEKAIEIAGKIQEHFLNDRTHHRLLRAKLWAFEACVDANRIAYASSGLTGIRKLSAPTTRLYLEASALLSICLLRDKKFTDAKIIIKETISNINNISSERTRRQFQKRLIERIEEECIFTELMGTADAPLDQREVEAKAVLLLQRSTDDEILKLIGNSIPSTGILLLRDVRSYSIEQLPPADRKLLPPPQKSEEPRVIGKTTFTLLRRIAWKTFCKPSSPIYKMWSKKVPEVFNEGYFSAAILSAMGEFRIGLPLLVSGILALVMKYSAEEFCELAKPKPVMIHKGDDSA